MRSCVAGEEKSTPDNESVEGKPFSSRGGASRRYKDTAPTSKYLLGRVAPYSTIDIADGYIASVSENGKGVLNKIAYTKTKHLNLQAFNPSHPSPIVFEELNRIQVS